MTKRRAQLDLQDFAVLMRSNHRLEIAALLREQDRLERELAEAAFRERMREKAEAADERVRDEVKINKALAQRLSEKYGVDLTSPEARFDDETGAISGPPIDEPDEALADKVAGELDKETVAFVPDRLLPL